MQKMGTAATCMPVKLDDRAWEAVIFLYLSGDECAHDRLALTRTKHSVPVGMEGDVIETENGAVVVLRLEVHTFSEDPLAVEILFTPGDAAGHFETLKLLSQQHRLCWFFARNDFKVIHSQQHPLTPEQRQGFDALALGAVKHDAVVRCTGRYDANAALSAVAAHYQLKKHQNSALPPSKDIL